MIDIDHQNVFIIFNDSTKDIFIFITFLKQTDIIQFIWQVEKNISSFNKINHLKKSKLYHYSSLINAFYFKQIHCLIS
jgi:hypothetical protein